MSQTNSQTASEIRAVMATLSDMSGPQLVETFNLFAPGDDKVNKFSTKQKGFERTTALLQSIIDNLAPEEAELEDANPEADASRSKRQAGQQRAWNNTATREARSKRWACRVEGHGVEQTFRSVMKAFQALGLPTKRMQYVRKHMAANGVMPYNGYTFTATPLDDCDVD